MLACICGCHRAPAIVGRWHGTESVRGSQLVNELTVNEDGTYREETAPQFAKPTITLKAIDVGTWKLEGDKFATHLTDTNWEFSGTNAALVSRAQARFDGRKASIIASTNKQPPGTLTWHGNDEFALTDGKITETFRRK